MIKSIVFNSWQHEYDERRAVGKGIEEITKDLNVFIENNNADVISINTNINKDNYYDDEYHYDIWITVFYK